MSIKHCMSKVTDLERGIPEASNEWVGAMKDKNTETVQITIAIARVMQENIIAAEELPSVARAIAAQSLCRKPESKTPAELSGRQSGETGLFLGKPLGMDNNKLRESRDRIPSVWGRERGECRLVSLCQHLPTRLPVQAKQRNALGDIENP